MQQPGFQFLWKRKFDSPGAPVNALTQPVLLPNIIAYKGFKALAFVGASSDNVYAIDYELNRMFWTQHLATAVAAKGTAACPGGLGSITKATAVARRRRRRHAGAARERGRPAVRRRTTGSGDARRARWRRQRVCDFERRNGSPDEPAGRDRSDAAGEIPAAERERGRIDPRRQRRCMRRRRETAAARANGVWAVDLVGQDKTVATFDTEGAGRRRRRGADVRHRRNGVCRDRQRDSPVANAIVSLDPKDAQAARLVYRTVAVHLRARGLPVQGQGSDRRREQGRPAVPARQRVAGRRRPQYAAAQGRPRSVGRRRMSPASPPGTTPPERAGSSPRSADPSAPTPKFAMDNGAVAGGALAAFTVVDRTTHRRCSRSGCRAESRAHCTPAIVNGVVFALASGEAGGAGAERSVRPPRCCTHSTAQPARNCGRAARRLRLAVRGVGPPAVTARCMSRPTTERSTRLACPRSADVQPSRPR